MALGVMVVVAPLEHEVVIGRDFYEKLNARLSGEDVVFSKLIVGYVVAKQEARRLSDEADGVVVVPVTGGTDRIIYEAARVIEKPVFIYAHPEYNALASVREAIAALSMEGRSVDVLYGLLEEAHVKLKPLIQAAKALSGLRGSRLGAVGKPEPWLLTVKDHGLFRERFGVEVVSIDWDEMLEEAKRAPAEEVKRIVSGLRERFGKVVVGDEDLDRAVRVYLGLKRVVEKYRVSAVAVEARDMLVEELRDWGPYLAVSLLSDEGIPADYEVDLEAVFTKYIVYLLTGQPSFMANITIVEPEKRTVVFSHCTVPTSMIDTSRSTLLTYFETDRSVAIRGVLREGEEVTFARIGGPRLDKMLVGHGRIVNGDLGRSDLCRTQILVEIDGDPMNLVRYPLGNHTIVSYGDHRESLRAFCKLAGIEVLEP